MTDNSNLTGDVSLSCQLDYTNRNETRLIVTNTSGGDLAAGRRLVWSAGDDRGAFFLKAEFGLGELLSFGLNAKGDACSVRAVRPDYVLSQ